jgi:hypothetical protein
LHSLAAAAQTDQIVNILLIQLKVTIGMEAVNSKLLSAYEKRTGGVCVCCCSFVVSSIRVAKRNGWLMEAVRPTIYHSTVLLIMHDLMPTTAQNNRQSGREARICTSGRLAGEHALFALVSGRFSAEYARRGGRAERHQRVLNAADTHSLTHVNGLHSQQKSGLKSVAAK